MLFREAVELREVALQRAQARVFGRYRWRLRRQHRRRQLVQPVPLLERAQLPLAVDAELRVQPLEGRKVDVHLLRQLADVAARVGLHLLLVAIHLRLGRFDLRLEELRGPRRLLGPHLRVLIHVERRDGVGHVGHRLAPGAGEAEIEGHRLRRPLTCSGPGELDLDVAPHLFDWRCPCRCGGCRDRGRSG
jgi:hypothetical protein